jgi:HD-GYP domain-containing protein (c-di-GMP phosphodiesterase class II)
MPDSSLVVTTEASSVLEVSSLDLLEGLFTRINNLGQQDIEASLGLAREALALAQGSNDIHASAEAHYHVGHSLYFLSDYPTARFHLREALNLYKTLGDHPTHAATLLSLGALKQELGELTRALEYLERSLAMYQRLQDPLGEVKVLRSLGNVQYRLGDFSKAFGLYQRALELHEHQAAPNPPDSARLYALRAVALTGLGQQASGLDKFRYLEQALLDSSKALHLHETLELPWDLLNIKQGRLELFIALEDFVAAETLFPDVLNLAKTLGDQPAEAETLVIIGDLYRAMNLPEQAVLFYEQAVSLYEVLEVKDYTVFEVHQKLAGLLETLGDYALALAHYKAFHTLSDTYKSEAALKQAQLFHDQLALENARLAAEVQRLRNEELESLVARRTEQLENSQFEMLERLAVVAEFRDDDMRGHTQRVGELAATMAERLGLPEDTICHLRLAARLHDIGKISVPDTILMKPAKLTTEEWELLKTHATIGAQMLEGGESRLLELAREIALTHHERFDGAGYPNGLKGEVIPLSGRILAVADVYDALIHERPYKPAWTKEQALEEMRAQAGQHFDPKVVEVFLKIVEKESEA